MKLIVGLGNPGRQYTNTRHNLGFLVCDALAEQNRVEFTASQALLALTATVTVEGQKVVLVKPTTFMNASGESVIKVMSKKGIKPQDLCVVCDDLSLAYGALRFRPSGTAGGHNGIKSIIAHLGVTDFPRLRMGIGRPAVGVDVADYVLSNFTPGERLALPDFINTGALCVNSWLTSGTAVTMNQFNKRKQSNE